MERASQTPAIVPLSLLEALQNLDTPLGDGTEEVAGELLLKRLGLSRTVSVETERYAELAEQHGFAETAHVTALFALVARRSDHRLVFADAGRRVARRMSRTVRVAAAVAHVIRAARWRRRLRYRLVGRLVARYFDGSLDARNARPQVTVRNPLSMAAAADGRACTFYSAALAELFRVVAQEEVAVEHSQCRGLGALTCEWTINQASAVLR